MPKYVDGYVLAVPKKKIQAYRRMAQQAGKIWRKHGALEYFECVGDDLNPVGFNPDTGKPGKWPGITFPNTVKAKPGETVIFSFIVFKSRAHRNQVNAKVMKDPAMSYEQWKDKPMPFDMKRMVYGGFKAIVEA